MNYSEHYRKLGEPIREIVRRGQDILTAGRRHMSYRYNRALYEHCGRYSGHPTHLNIIQPVGLPETLGELCIRLAQDRLSRRFSWQLRGYHVPWKEAYDVRGDIRQLRELMWHKHRGPQETMIDETRDNLKRLNWVLKNHGIIAGDSQSDAPRNGDSK